MRDRRNSDRRVVSVSVCVSERQQVVVGGDERIRGMRRKHHCGDEPETQTQRQRDGGFETQA